MPRLPRWWNFRVATVVFALFSLAAIACGGGGGGGGSMTEPPAPIVRRIVSHLRSDPDITFTARYEVNGREAVASATSVVAGATSIINAELEASDLPRGRHHVRVTITSVRPRDARFLLTASIAENNRTVVPDVPDVIATLGAGGALDLFVTF